ncbi:MAG: hypothetical protein GX547_02850 [Phycisphaerae bacterium]|nr:hypothetical protein [Phycisphaerae bacterium]
MRAGVARKTAFSLAEMMIALVILGFGLLVIGAALPVGLQYERDMIDRATGQAAAEYALDVIEQRVRLVRDPYDETLGKTSNYADIFQPRRGTTMSPPPGLAPGGQPHELAVEVPTMAFPNGRLWEPFIKVRPLLPVGIDPDDISRELDAHVDETPHAYVERQIRECVEAILPDDWMYQEWDGVGNEAWTGPTLPSMTAVYPPVPFALRFRTGTGSEPQDLPGDFLRYPYRRLWVTEAPATEATRRKVLESGVSWVAFYRRVSYAEGSDPNLYEVIAVATRRPAGYFFPWYRQDTQAPRKAIAPVPRLIEFEGYEKQPSIAWRSVPRPGPLPEDRILEGSTPEPTLVFVCNEDDGRMLPAGSIIIPAANDDLLSAGALGGARQYAGFIPHAPEALPIYEVVQRERRQPPKTGWDITVKNNGFFPWVQGDLWPNGSLGKPAWWPVWVIPPAFKGLDSQGKPLYDDRSPVLAVARRIIRFTEVP